MRKFVGFVWGIVFVPFALVGTTRHVYEADSAQGIQDSINASSAYDTVMVHTGTYFVRDVDSVGITMQDGVILISPHPDSVTLSGFNSDTTDTAYHVIYCSFGDPSSHAALIKGFTITNGAATGSWPHCGGGGIYCDSSSPAIDSCVIKNNFADGGGGLFIYNSSPTITGNTIEHNSATAEQGGGLHIACSSPIISGNVISYNSSLALLGKAGGLGSVHSSPTITGNTITHNAADYIGGGLYIYGSSPTITGNTIAYNSAVEHPQAVGGGLFIREYSSAIITGNTIAHNVAKYHSGGIGVSFYSSAKLADNTIVGNIAGAAGALYNFSSIVVINSCFIVDNGSTGYPESLESGLLFTAYGTDTISHSHLYCNTFQPDTEVYNNTGTELPVEHNFWWFTDSLEIDALFHGPKDFSPWEYDFIPCVPGEPTGIDSVRNYNNDYSSVIHYLQNDPDTLYLRIYGEDRNTNLREAAIAILKSSIYPTGIAVALVETDTNSGIYEGKATAKVSTGSDIIRTDDIYQIIRVNSLDTIKIVANMDTTKEFLVGYEYQGIEEMVTRTDRIFFAVSPNPARGKLHIRYAIPEPAIVKINLYDIVGRRVKAFVDAKKEPGSYSLDCDIRNYGSGVYFLRLESGKYKTVEKVLLVK